VSIINPRKRLGIGYLPLLDDTALQDERVRPEAVSPEERDSALRDIGGAVGGTVSRVGDALSAPGDYTRGLLVGRAGERVTGREMLRDMGLAGPEDNWWNFTGGLIADVATDPLSFVSGPAASLTKAGIAAKKLGLLDNAATAATKKAISSGAARAGNIPKVAQFTKKALEESGQRTLSTFDPAVVGRPLYGTRTARRAVSLDDLIAHADNPQEAEQAARRLLGGEFETVRKQKLAKTFGVGLPLSEPSITGDLLGSRFGDQYADALDTIGQGWRWSLPGRMTASAFDKRVDRAIDPESQIVNIANFAARQKGGAAANRYHVYQLAKLHEAAGDVFDEEAGRRIGRIIEGPAAMQPGDLQWLDQRPAVRDYINEWKNVAPEVLDARRALGLAGEPLRDEYGIEYLPHTADPALEMQARRNRKLGQALSIMTPDQLGRTDTMRLPGGRDTIIELSQDPMVSGPKRGKTTDDEAAQYLATVMQSKLQPGQPVPDQKKLVRLARILHELPDEVTKHTPLFGQHPTQSIGSYLEGNGEAMGTATTLLDSLATFARDGAPGTIDKGRSISMKQALERLGLKSYDDGVGATQQMRDRLAKLSGSQDPDSINLSMISVPEEHVSRLVRAREAFGSEEPLTTLEKYLDWYTQAWKGSILAWPARAVRDLYSGAASNWLSGAFDLGSVSAVKALMTHGAGSEAFLRELRQIPKYGGDDGVALFFSDLAGTKLVSGPAAFEAGASSSGKRALDPIIGAEPNRVGVGSIVSELASQPGRSWKQFGQDFATWRSQLKPMAETKNPLLRAGEKMNTLTDGINRLSGYLSLMKQGYTADAAAAAMKRAHVDYGSLSSFERRYMKAIFPWYSYQSRIFREVLSQLVERPGGRYGAMLKTSERAQDSNDDQYIPSALRASLALPIPEMLGGKPAPGTQSYLTDIDLPGIDQINMFETPGTVSGSLSGTARQVGMQLHPAYRTLAETMFGTDLFGNRPLGEGVSPLDAIGRSVTGDQSFDVPALVDKGVELLPFAGRPLYTARALLDTSGDADMSSRAAKTLVNALTGVKRRDVTHEYALSDAARQLENTIDPYTRDFKTTYIPEALLPYVPQWAQQRMKVARALQRENRNAKKKRTTKSTGKKKQKDTSSPFD
jgi:AraC-like DNA-binding protein